MKRLLILALLFAIALPAQAQTATPTTSPFVHLQGEYQFETDTNITWSGTWTTVTSGQIRTRESSSTAAYAAFTVSRDICSFAINGYSTAAAGYSITFNGVTSVTFTGTFPNTSYSAIIDTTFLTGDATVKIQLAGAGAIFLDSFRLLQCQSPSTELTAIPTATPPNTPVDTPTAIVLGPSPTALNIDPLLTLIAGLTPVTMTPSYTPTITPTPTATYTPTPTNTPTPTPTYTPAPWVLITMQPGDGTPEGQVIRFEYTASASDVYIADLLALLLFSLWGFFFVSVLVLWRHRK